MTIQLTPELAAALQVRAQQEGIPPEDVAVNVLSTQLLPRQYDLTPRDEWERQVLANTADCGVSLTDEDLSRENMYD